MALGRKTGGRKPGSLNKSTADVKALAQVHGPAAVEELVRLMSNSESDAARVAAIKELLDRGYGKAKQSVELDGAMAGVMTVTYVTSPSSPSPALGPEDYET